MGGGNMITAGYGQSVAANYEVSTESSGEHSHPIPHDGGGELHENRPPYFALCFIMKVAI
jgi:hypothetical protein